jgi:hypothetical protein
VPTLIDPAFYLALCSHHSESLVLTNHFLI